MFTGIVQEVGEIRHIRRGDPWVIRVQAPGLVDRIVHGQSVAVAGVCLTAFDICQGGFSANLSPATVKATTFASFRASRKVNLELAMQIQGRLDGHIVQGHVDTTGLVVKTPKKPDYELTIKLEEGANPLVVEKGSIAIDGVSLTVSRLQVDGVFSIALIPVTLKNTTLSILKGGDRVNLEYDIIGKYVARFLKF